MNDRMERQARLTNEMLRLAQDLTNPQTDSHALAGLLATIRGKQQEFEQNKAGAIDELRALEAANAPAQDAEEAHVEPEPEEEGEAGFLNNQEQEGEEAQVEPDVDALEPAAAPDVDALEPEVEPAAAPDVDALEPEVEPAAAPDVDALEPEVEPAAAPALGVRWLQKSLIVAKIELSKARLKERVPQAIRIAEDRIAEADRRRARVECCKTLGRVVFYGALTCAFGVATFNIPAVGVLVGAGSVLYAAWQDEAHAVFSSETLIRLFGASTSLAVMVASYAYDAGTPIIFADDLVLASMACAGLAAASAAASFAMNR